MDLCEEICTRGNARVLSEHKKYLQTKMDAQQKLIDLCVVYKKVRPALVFAKAILFFKPKWKAALQELLDNLDGACPG